MEYTLAVPRRNVKSFLGSSKENAPADEPEKKREAAKGKKTHLAEAETLFLSG